MNHVELIYYFSWAYQRFTWQKLKLSISSTVIMANEKNIIVVWKNLLKLNIERGRGLLCMEILSNQENNYRNTSTYAALMALVNDGVSSFS